MTFTEWKQKNCPGWYLNDRQQDEALHEQYLMEQRNHEKGYKSIPAQSIRQDCDVQR